MKLRIFTISNFISFFRLLLSIPLIFLLIGNYRLEAAGLFILAFISDILDGFIARKLNQVSEFGKIIDPLADKIFVGTAVVILFLLELIPMWFLLVILFRDIIIFIGGIIVSMKIKKVIPSDYIGKISVFIIGLVLLSITAGIFENIIFYMMILASIASGVSLGYYIIRASKLIS